MIPTLGYGALICAMLFALAQGLCALRCSGLREARKPVLFPYFFSFSLLQFLALLIAFACLIVSFLQSDFSVALVAAHSHTQKPWFYKLSASWGQHEGSMVLFVLVMAAYGAVLARCARRQGDESRTLFVRAGGIMGLLGALLALFILCTSNPFARLFPVPLEGDDLNPLLQDIGLALHPPMLYTGYVGLSALFALTVAALMRGLPGREWARRVHGWILFPWIFLTAGIGLGGWWAYRELGWGGWWFWDPVENASLLPWLFAGALLHVNLALRNRGTLGALAAFLGIACFAASLFGTFLVRSGMITSVHSFASDPARGVYLLLFFVVSVGLALALLCWRMAERNTAEKTSLRTREGLIAAASILWIVAAFSIALGTLAPLIAEAISAGQLSLGAPFYNRAVLPLFALLALLAGLAHLLRWGLPPLASFRKRALLLLLGAGCAGAIAFVTPLLTPLPQRVWLVGGSALSGWLLSAVIYDVWEMMRRRNLSLKTLGMPLAHGGVGLIVLAACWSSLNIATIEANIVPNEPVRTGPYEVVLREINTGKLWNYLALQADIDVTDVRSGERIRLNPEYRFYPVRGQYTSEVALANHGGTDLYAVAGNVTPEGALALRFHAISLMPVLWAGMVLLCVGGAVSWLSRLRPAVHIGDL